MASTVILQVGLDLQANGQSCMAIQPTTLSLIDFHKTTQLNELLRSLGDVMVGNTTHCHFSNAPSIRS